MSDYRFYIARIKDDEIDTAPFRDLENDFPGLRYKQITGLNAYGSPKLYTETFVEEDKAEVFIPETAPREQTEISLTLYFFGVSELEEDEVQYEEMSHTYHEFVNFISGCQLLYYDTARNRKVQMYLSSATTPKTDRLYGSPYMEVEFKFKNVYGRSFDVNDNSVIGSVGFNIDQ